MEYPLSRVIASEGLERISKGINNLFGILSGGVTSTVAGLEVSVTAIPAYHLVIAGSPVVAGSAGGSVTLDAADATHPRLDVITVATSGTGGFVKGTAAATPAPPAIGDTKLALCEIIIVANDTTLAAGDLTDKRQILLPRKTSYTWRHVTGTTSAPDVTYTPIITAELGTAAADGVGYFNFDFPTNFQALTKATIVGVTEGTGNLRYSVATSFGASGEARATHTDSITATTIAATDGQWLAIDVIAAFTGVLAGDQGGFAFTRLGSDGADTITAFHAVALELEWV